MVKRSQGGTAVKFTSNANNFNADITQFNNSTTNVSHIYELELAIRAAIAANPNIKFKAILWHQGETDGDLNNRFYYRDLCRVIFYIRGIVGNPKLPFIFGTVPTVSASYKDYIQADFEKIAANINDTHLIDMSGATLQDSFHFDSASSELLGDQMYNIMKSQNMLRRAQ